VPTSSLSNPGGVVGSVGAGMTGEVGVEDGNGVGSVVEITVGVVVSAHGELSIASSSSAGVKSTNFPQ
jgi:hypothetical protein